MHQRVDYTEQSSWLLFLKYLDSLETDKATEAELEGKKYSYTLDPACRWSKWAAPKTKGGEIDHNKALTGERRIFESLHPLPNADRNISAQGHTCLRSSHAPHHQQI